MTSKRQMITGELRKWRLLVKPDKSLQKWGIVTGIMYDDAFDIWEDGEVAVIHIRDWFESANYYVAATHHTAIKCPKDEELKNGSSG